MTFQSINKKINLTFLKCPNRPLLYINKDKQYYLEVHKQLSEREAELAKTLNEKYGTGTINIETGVID